MYTKRPSRRNLFVSGGLIAFACAEFAYGLLFTVWFALSLGVVFLPFAVIMFRYDLAQYRAHQAASPSEDEPAP
ncbi:hypothetical protein Q7689_08225 [Nocardiopsis tropica]|uniref:hypothetical protein n=1 Tax=Nocardiopsis tropica TaxID=109330 RepID=UPI002E852187|nr:hypothetical protein [Nocardiopsis tropica]